MSHRNINSRRYIVQVRNKNSKTKGTWVTHIKEPLHNNTARDIAGQITTNHPHLDARTLRVQ